jgi:NADPH2:quinone reductase
MGYWWGGYLNFRPEVLTGSLRELLTWYEDGRLTPHIGAALPLDRADEAYELLRARKSTGKVVVTM